MTLEEQIARLAHRGQVDKAGNTYIQHVERVVASVKGDARTKATAWLHDVVEDSSFTYEVMLGLGVSADVLRSVNMLTRVPNQSYEDYIGRIYAYGGERARAVKLADLRDHLENPGCPESLRPRYEKALARLEQP